MNTRARGQGTAPRKLDTHKRVRAALQNEVQRFAPDDAADPVGFTQGAAEVLANRAADKLINEFSPNGITEDRLAQAVAQIEAVRSVVLENRTGGKEVRSDRKVSKREINDLMKQHGICGIFPFC